MKKNLSKKMCGILLGVLLFCQVFVTPTQAIYNADETQNYFDVLYNNFSGLLTSEANDIIQTSDGHIWIASYSSLVRYDGKEFTTYASQGISSVLRLFIDSSDRLWIGTNNDGMILYENNEFHFVSQDMDIPSFSTRSISQLEDGSILVGTALGMYTISPDMTVEILDDPRVKDTFVSELMAFGENQTIGVSKTGDIFLLQDKEIIDFLPVEEWEYALPLCALPLEEENDSYFLLGTTDDYLLEMRYHPQNGFDFQKISTGDLKYINTLFQDSKGKIWVGSDFGVGYLDSQNQTVVLDYLSVSQSIETIIEDFEGNYWLASSKEGVLKLNPSQFKNISASLPNVVQFNALEIVDGLIYVVSSNGIDIIRQSDLKLIENDLTAQYRNEYFRCVQKDDQGNLWFSSYTEDGLIKYNPKTEEITNFNYEGGINYSRIRSTMTGSDGKIWVATGNGLYVVEEDEVIAYFGSNEGFQSVEILTVTEDEAGRIFVGTDGAGVYVIEDLQVSKRINREVGLLSDIILRTETDPLNGGTWIVTGNSIAFYDPDLETIKNIEKFPYGNNFDLMFYEEIMVILCSNGIYFTTQESMLSDEPVLEFTHKNHLNGLYSAPVANSFSKIEDDILYLCGYQNLTAFDLSLESSNHVFVPTIDLPNISVNDQVIYPTKENTYLLPNTANFLEFNIFIPTYALEDYNVSYSLLGYDEFMHTASYSAYIDPTYTNLPGGEYTFSISLTDNRTGQVINEESFSIIKEYSFTEHPASKLVFTVFAIFLVCSVIYFVMKRKEAINKEKEAVVMGMFHDTVEVLAKVIDAKDCYTNGHSKRVAYYTRAMTKALSFSPEEEVSAYGIGLLHDVGKVSIPDKILNKPGRLEPEEFEVMKSHANRGADILEGITAWSDLVVGAKYHHERFDGKGYASGLKGEEIPLIARIICVADAFDAMYSSRVYRKKMKLEDVVKELEANSGTQFDPNLVKVFIDLIKSGKLNEMLDTISDDEEG